jgi:hypothetical protein
MTCRRRSDLLLSVKEVSFISGVAAINMVVRGRGFPASGAWATFGQCFDLPQPESNPELGQSDG